MKAKDFDKLVKDTIENLVATLKSKGDEYDSDVDRLHNFKRTGRMKDECPEKALWGMVAKHDAAVADLIDSCDACNEDEKPMMLTKEFIEEKIGDRIAYNVLLMALLIERLE